MMGAEGMAKQLKAEIKTFSVVSQILPEQKEIKFKVNQGNNSSLQYSKLVLAIGADVIRLPIQGDGAQDI